jgi:hypothetical protein
MGTPTKAEQEVLNDLQGAVRKAMRSKPTLRILTKLQDQGLIEFDPFAGTAEPTDAGRALQSTTQEL